MGRRQDGVSSVYREISESIGCLDRSYLTRFSEREGEQGSEVMGTAGSHARLGGQGLFIYQGKLQT